MSNTESKKRRSGPVIRLADFLSHFAAAGGQAAQACARESKKHLIEFFDQDCQIKLRTQAQNCIKSLTVLEMKQPRAMR